MGLVTPAEYVGCVEQAYRMHGEGRFYMDPKGHIVLDKYPGEWEAMPSYIEELESVVRGADVVVTITPARGPIVLDEWISPGTHIAAVGADKGGDQELDPRILQRARIFVDDIRQCRTDGEINVALSAGLISESDIAGEIGEVVVGKREGRR